MRLQLQPDAAGLVAIGCSAVPRGFVHPEEVSAQVQDLSSSELEFLHFLDFIFGRLADIGPAPG